MADAVAPVTSKEPTTSSPSPTSATAGNAGATGAATRSEGPPNATPTAQGDGVELSPQAQAVTGPKPERPTDPADLMGVHLLSAYTENGSAATQQGWQAASGGGVMTDAGALNGMSDPSDPAAMKRREQLIQTLKWGQERGLDVNLRLDYDWGNTVPRDEVGRRDYANKVASFLEDARRAGVDTDKLKLILGNEPNLTGEGGGRIIEPEEYVAAVREVNQELQQRGLGGTKLGGPALSPGGQGEGEIGSYFQRCMEAGLGHEVDFYAMHEYEDSLHNISHLADIAHQYGASKPIVISEFGIPRGNGRGPREQAESYKSFAARVSAWNQDPNNPPIQGVTLWVADRGEGQEGYLPTREMFDAMRDMTHGKFDSGGGYADVGGAGGGRGSDGGGGGRDGARGGGGPRVGGATPAGRMSPAEVLAAIRRLVALIMQERRAGQPVEQEQQMLSQLLGQAGFLPRELMPAVQAALGVGRAA